MKDLLKKFWKELEHFKEGGELEVVYNDGSNGEFKDFHSPECIRHLIIKDDYYTYRKALAEGKVIESNFGAMGFGCPDKWAPMSGQFGYRFEHRVECYRIKPDEPKFKIGDWVKHEDNSIGQIISTTPPTRDFQVQWKDQKGVHLTEKLTLWQPKPGEWCWFYEADPLHVPRLGKLEGDFQSPFSSSDGYSYQFIEPYLGPLPTHLKE